MGRLRRQRRRVPTGDAPPTRRRAPVERGRRRGGRRGRPLHRAHRAGDPAAGDRLRTPAPVEPLGPGSPLWHDTIAVAKVMQSRPARRARHIRFPEGILYEDQPFTVALWSSATPHRDARRGRLPLVRQQRRGRASRSRRGGTRWPTSVTVSTANRAIDALLADPPRPRGGQAREVRAARPRALRQGPRRARRRLPATSSSRRPVEYLSGSCRRPSARPWPNRYRLVVSRAACDGSAESAVAAALFAYRRQHLSTGPRRARRRVVVALPSTRWTPETDLTELVAAQHQRGRILTTVTTTAVMLDRRRLSATVHVVDGDRSLRPWTRGHFRLVRRSTGAVVSSTTAPIGIRRGFVVRLRLPHGAELGGDTLDLKWSVSLGLPPWHLPVVSRRGRTGRSSPHPAGAHHPGRARPVQGLPHSERQRVRHRDGCSRDLRQLHPEGHAGRSPERSIQSGRPALNAQRCGEGQMTTRSC